MRFDLQEMQNDLDRETSSLQELEAQKQDAQDRLEEMDQQKAKLEDMLNDVRQKCQEESQMVSQNKHKDSLLDPQMTYLMNVKPIHSISVQISSLQTQIHSQESDLQSQEEELGRAKADLNRLQQEEAQLEQSLQAGRIQLETIIKSLKATQDEINQVVPSEHLMYEPKVYTRGRQMSIFQTDVRFFQMHSCKFDYLIN